MLMALHAKIIQLDSTLAFTDRQMVSYLTQFSRNSQCTSLILHEQLLRTMGRQSLPAVSKHLLASFPSGTQLSSESELLLDLSANADACATTKTLTLNDSRKKLTQHCFKCKANFNEVPRVKHLQTCDAVPQCDKCEVNPGSHCTSMCVIYSKWWKKIALRKNANSAQLLAPKMKKVLQIQDCDDDDDDDSRFFRSVASVTSVLQQPTLDDSLFFQSGAVLQQSTFDASLFFRSGSSVSSVLHDDDNDDFLFSRSVASVTQVLQQPTLEHALESPLPLLSDIYTDEEDDSYYFACSSESSLPSFSDIIFTDEEDDISHFACPSSLPLIQQRELTPVERGTSGEHGNSTNRTPFAHLLNSLLKIFSLTLIISASAVPLGLDTMCWHHFTGDASLLINVQQITSTEVSTYETKVASGSKICPTHRGDLPVILRTVTGDKLPIIFSDVLYSPNFDNLLSIGQLESESKAASQPTFNWNKDAGFLRFRFPGMSNWVDVPHLIAHNCHYLIPLSCGPCCYSKNKVAASLPRSATVPAKLAQRRLGFISPLGVQQTIANTVGLSLNDNPLKLPVNEAALHGMQSAAPNVKILLSLTGDAHVRRHWTTHRYETLHIDAHGPYSPGFFNQVTSFMSFTTGTGVTWVKFLKSGKAPDLILATREAFTRLGTPRHLRTDNSMTLFTHDVATTTAFTDFLVSCDVVPKISAPYCQWQNGGAERAGRTVYEHATAMLFDAGLAPRWWPFAVAHYADVSNSIATKTLTWKTPIEAHFNIKPCVSHFRCFGCPVFIHKSKVNRDSPAAFTSRTQRGIHLGNAVDAKLGVYLIFNLETKAFVKTQSLYFDEDFQMVKKGINGWKFQDSLLNVNYASHLFSNEFTLPPDVSEIRVGNAGLTGTPPQSVSDNIDDNDEDTTTPSSMPKVTTTPPSMPEQPQPLPEQPQPIPFAAPVSAPQRDSGVSSDNILTGRRTRNQVERIDINPTQGGARNWHDNANDAASTVLSSDFTFSAMETLASLVLEDHIMDAIPFRSAASTTLVLANPDLLISAPQKYLTRKIMEFSPSTRTLMGISLSAASLVALSTVSIASPNTPPVMASPNPPANPPVLTVKPIVDFLHSSRQTKNFIMEHGAAGEKAFDDEMQGMIDAGVLSIPVPLPKGHRAPPATMLSSQKADGRLKCRLVYRGDLQVAGLNYVADELYAPVMDKTSFRMLLAIGAAHHAHIETLDINLAFLYGEMKDEIYMSPPKGITLPFGMVWKILKSLYGTKQAPAIWYGVLRDWLYSIGWESTKADSCVFYKFDKDGNFFYIGVHVDDMLMVTTSSKMLSEFKEATTARFSFKDQGELNNREFTGCFVEYNREEGRVSLSCDRSVENLLKLTGFEDCNPHVTPIAKHDYRDTSLDTSYLAKIFGSISGHANWLSVLCRPDIALASSLLSTYNWLEPTVSDVKDAIRLLRYLKGTLAAFPRMGVTFIAKSYSSINAALTPISFADSDHAGDPAGGQTTKRSRSGQCIWFGGGLIYWRSALQKTVATSTTYAEIIALSDMCKQLVWILALLSQLSLPQCTVPVYEDNQPAIDSLMAHRNSQRTRHYDIRYFWVRELMDEQKIIDLRKIHTKENYADFWTKILPKDEMIQAIRSFMFEPLPIKFHHSNKENTI
jgi:hypothetical protein